MSTTPNSLIAAVRYFSDLSVCNAYMRRIKWPDGKVICPQCRSERIGEITTRSMLRCKDCRKQFSYKLGTIFEDSPLGLDKWFVALWADGKDNISGRELARTLDVTQKTAWLMQRRIREKPDSATLLHALINADSHAGMVDVDDAYEAEGNCLPPWDRLTNPMRYVGRDVKRAARLSQNAREMPHAVSRTVNSFSRRMAWQARATLPP